MRDAAHSISQRYSSLRCEYKFNRVPTGAKRFRKGLSCLVVLFTRSRQSASVNALVQAKADALLDAYELYGAEIDDEILDEVKSLRVNLVAHITTNPGLPSGVPAANMFKSMLEGNTGTIVHTIACQIEQRKGLPGSRDQISMGVSR